MGGSTTLETFVQHRFLNFVCSLPAFPSRFPTEHVRHYKVSPIMEHRAPSLLPAGFWHPLACLLRAPCPSPAQPSPAMGHHEAQLKLNYSTDKESPDV